MSDETLPDGDDSWNQLVALEQAADAYERQLKSDASVSVDVQLAQHPELPQKKLRQILTDTLWAFRRSQGLEAGEEISSDGFRTESSGTVPGSTARPTHSVPADLPPTRVAGAAYPFAPDYPDVVPGDVVGGFRLTGVLGSGAFGQVFRAVPKDGGTAVAVKLIRRKAQPDDEAAESNSDSEVDLLCTVSHPAILPVIATGTHREYRWFASPLMAETFRDLIGRAPVPPAQAVELIAAIADGLAECHRRRIIHRDIKPSNLFLTEDGRPVAGDFGIALSFEEFGNGPELAGTPKYMSPEQAAGDAHVVDGRSDLFSLGIVLYQLLTGRHPFLSENSTREDLSRRRRMGLDRPLSQLVPVPKALDAVCRRVLQPNPDDRYRDAREFSAALRSSLRPEPAFLRGIRGMGRISMIFTAVISAVVLAAMLKDSSSESAVSESDIRAMGSVLTDETIEGASPAADHGDFRRSEDKNGTAAGAVDYGFAGLLEAYSEREKTAVLNARTESARIVSQWLSASATGDSAVPGDDCDSGLRCRVIVDLAASDVTTDSLTQALLATQDPAAAFLIVSALCMRTGPISAGNEVADHLQRLIDDSEDAGLFVISRQLLVSRNASPERLIPPDSVRSAPFGQEMIVLGPVHDAQLGSPADEYGRSDVPHLEEPRMSVSVPYQFAVGVTEVTLDQLRSARPVSRRGPPPEQPHLPAGSCYWNTAAWYCNELSRLDGIPEDEFCYRGIGIQNGTQQYVPRAHPERLRGYRLPTEAEWEVAARCGSSASRFFGDDPELAPTFANVGTDQVRPVASCLPNRFGLYDMLGNVSEWIHENDYFVSEGIPERRHVRIRGGSAWTPLEGVRAAARYAVPSGNTSERLGFRIARTIFPDDFL